MNLIHGWVVAAACFMTIVTCGVIDGNGYNVVENNDGNVEEVEEECVLEDEDAPQNTLLSIHDDLPSERKRLGHVTKKRCPKVGSPNVGSIVGASNAPQHERNDLHSILNKRLCDSCKNSPSCKLRNKCDVCFNWCGTEETSKSASQPEPVVGSPWEGNPLFQPNSFHTMKENLLGSSILRSTPFQNSFFNRGAQDPLTLTSRSNFESSTEKKTYNVESSAIQPMKGIILRLLGISNLKDVDDMGVWISTVSNKSPEFSGNGHAERILGLCKDAGSELKEEAKKGAKDMIGYMWMQLQKELQNQILKHDEPYLTKEELSKFIDDFTKNLNLEPAVSSPSKHVLDYESDDDHSEILPRYPLDSAPGTFLIPQEMNPDIIEGPPDDLGEEVAAIRSRLSDDEFDENDEDEVEDEPDDAATHLNPRINAPSESPNLNPLASPPPLAQISADAIDLMKDVSQDVARQSHKLNNLYGNLKDDPPLSKPPHNLHRVDSSTSATENQPITLSHLPGQSNVDLDLASRNKELKNDGAVSAPVPSEDLNNAYWNQRLGNVNSNPEIDELGSPHKKHKGKHPTQHYSPPNQIQYKPGHHGKPSNHYKKPHHHSRTSEPEDTDVIGAGEPLQSNDQSIIFPEDDNYPKNTPGALQPEKPNNLIPHGQAPNADMTNVELEDDQPDARTHKKFKKKGKFGHHQVPSYYRDNDQELGMNQTPNSDTTDMELEDEQPDARTHKKFKKKGKFGHHQVPSYYRDNDQELGMNQPPNSDTTDMELEDEQPDARTHKKFKKKGKFGHHPVPQYYRDNDQELDSDQNNADTVAAPQEPTMIMENLPKTDGVSYLPQESHNTETRQQIEENSNPKATEEYQDEENMDARTHKHKKHKGKLPMPQYPTFYRNNQAEDTTSNMDTVAQTEGPGTHLLPSTQENSNVVGMLNPKKTHHLDVPKPMIDVTKEDAKGRSKFLAPTTKIPKINHPLISLPPKNEFVGDDRKLVTNVFPNVKGETEAPIKIGDKKTSKSFEKVKATLEKLRSVTKNLRKEIITEPPNLMDYEDEKEDEDNIPLLRTSPSDSEKAPNNIVQELRKIPELILDKAEEKLNSAERALKNSDSILQSQPLENSFEMFSAIDSNPNRMYSLNKKEPSKDNKVLGAPFHSDEVSNIPRETDNTDIVSLGNRGRFEDGTSESSYLGKLIPKSEITVNNPKDIYFVGDGIKLPLNMVKKDDGALHLSVDLEKLCTCNSTVTCPHNQTAIEETVGSILEKEAELKDQLKDHSKTEHNKREEVLKTSQSIQKDTQVPESAGFTRMKNSIAGSFDPELQHENPEILKRSAANPKEEVESIYPETNGFTAFNEDPNLENLPKIIKLEGRDYKEQKEPAPVTTPTTTTTTQPTNRPLASLLSSAPSNTASDFFKEFWSRGFEDLKSKLPAAESFNPLSISQTFFKGFGSKMDDELERQLKRLTTEEAVVLQPDSPDGRQIPESEFGLIPNLPAFQPSESPIPFETPDAGFGINPSFPSLENFNPFSISEQVFKNFLPIGNGKSNDKTVTEPTPSPNVFFRPLEPTGTPFSIYEQMFKNFLPFGNEKFDGKTNEETSTPEIVYQQEQTTRPPDLGSKIKHFFVNRFDNDNEKFDIVTKTKGPFEFKGLEKQVKNNFKEFDDTVAKYKKENEEIIKNEAKAFLKANDQRAKEETGVVDNFVRWLKGVSLRNEK